MKHLVITHLEQYLSMADSHENPKVPKIVEIGDSQKGPWIRAITYPYSFLFEWQKYFPENQIHRDEVAKTLKDHGHIEGRVRDLTTGSRF